MTVGRCLATEYPAFCFIRRRNRPLKLHVKDILQGYSFITGNQGRFQAIAQRARGRELL